MPLTMTTLDIIANFAISSADLPYIPDTKEVMYLETALSAFSGETVADSFSKESKKLLIALSTRVSATPSSLARLATRLRLM